MVGLFSSGTDWDAWGNLVSTKTTGEEGVAVFAYNLVGRRKQENREFKFILGYKRRKGLRCI